MLKRQRKVRESEGIEWEWLFWQIAHAAASDKASVKIRKISATKKHSCTHTQTQMFCLKTSTV